MVDAVLFQLSAFFALFGENVRYLLHILYERVFNTHWLYSDYHFQIDIRIHIRHDHPLQQQNRKKTRPRWPLFAQYALLRCPGRHQHQQTHLSPHDHYQHLFPQYALLRFTGCQYQQHLHDQIIILIFLINIWSPQVPQYSLPFCPCHNEAIYQTLPLAP